MLVIGTMSGTSMDGIDVAALETDGSANCIKELGNTSISYSPLFKLLLKASELTIKTSLGDMDKARANFSQGLRAYLKNEIKILDINSKITELSAYLHGAEHSNQSITLDEVIQHSTYLHGLAIEKLLKATGLQAEQIDVIGYHGQIMFHRPSIGVSVIVGDGQALADQTGIAVVNDFRSLDVSMGGQGAPFAPLYHQALSIRDNRHPLVVVNCGGIANITVINKELIAFDTGPGNGLIDKLIRQRTNGQEYMDADGKYGKNGVVHKDVLKKLYKNAIIIDNKNYFTTIPPKSLDINDMKLIPELFELSLEDACRTLEAFTAKTIIKSFALVNDDVPKYLVLAGGGWNNPVILQELETRLIEKFGNDVKICKADEIGWNSQAMEAQIFAYLAVRSLQNEPLSLPKTTGVPRPTSGGHAYLPQKGATKAVHDLVNANPDVLRGYDV